MHFDRDALRVVETQSFEYFGSPVKEILLHTADFVDDVTVGVLKDGRYFIWGDCPDAFDTKSAMLESLWADAEWGLDGILVLASLGWLRPDAEYGVRRKELAQVARSATRALRKRSRALQAS